jgi:hypothetical protein
MLQGSWIVDVARTEEALEWRELAGDKIGWYQLAPETTSRTDGQLLRDHSASLDS